MKRRTQILLLTGMLVCSSKAVVLASDQVPVSEEIVLEENMAEEVTPEMAGDVAVDAAHFPDEMFRKYVSENCDTNKDGVLSTEEIAACTAIEVPYKGIKSLKGIEFFTSLKNLNCMGNNPLSDLDVSKNLLLEVLWCDSNWLGTLDVSKNVNLKDLRCESNNLKELDVSQNTKLERLWCGSFNEYKKLDLSKNTALKDLSCNNSKLTELDVSRNNALVKLNCSSNELTKLNVSGLTDIEELYCGGNRIVDLDLSKNAKLRVLQVEYNELTQLDLSSNTELTWLNCIENKLADLDVSNNIKLQNLGCDRNQLKELDVSGNTSLNSLRCSGNGMTKLTLGKSENLRDLDCEFNELVQLDVSGNTGLATITCNGNKLKELDLSSLTQLNSLHCYNNQLTSLKLSTSGSIMYLNCYQNQLRDLDLSNSTMLQVLSIDEEVLKNIDLSQYAQLGIFQVFLKSESLNTAEYPDFDSSKMSDMEGLTFENGIFTVIGRMWHGDFEMSGEFNYAISDNQTVAVTLWAPEAEEPEEPTDPDVPSKPDLPFEDLNVPEDNWKYQAVKYVYENGIMTGMGNDKIFAPDNTLTRAMFATILYRMAGQPAVEFDAERFTDVEGGRWYSEAIIWANDNQIVNGFADGNYGVESDITREQIAKMLYQYAVVCGYDTTASKELDEFTDKETVNTWAVDYIKWAAGSSMISGKPNEDGGFRIDPQGKATRAECAKMIQKFEQSNGK